MAGGAVARLQPRDPGVQAFADPGVQQGEGIVGEMAVVAGIERTASVTADTDMKVEVMSRREFTSLLDEFPGIARKMLVGALTRIHELEPSIG